MSSQRVVNEEERSLALIQKVQQTGDAQALEQLLAIHQSFIYNVAWKFTNDQTEAKDLTQEVMIKVITRVNTFQGKSAFKTWLYKIVFREFLKTRKRPMESRWDSFDQFAEELNQIPSPELSVEEELEQQDRTKTARVRCMSGMLMCLTREQRLIYILGHVFNIDSHLGAEIFEISRDNYRQKLTRARKEFHAFMNQQCGLVKLENPCRCSKKAKAMEAAGKMQTNKRLFDPAFSATIAKYAEQVADEVADVVDKKYIEFFQQHPTREDLDTETIIEEILNDRQYHQYFQSPD